MTLRGWSWFNGDATKPASVRIAEGDTVRKVEWTPRGEQPVSVPQLALARGMQIAWPRCHPEDAKRPKDRLWRQGRVNYLVGQDPSCAPLAQDDGMLTAPSTPPSHPSATQT